MDRTDHAHARLRRFLEREPVIWLSTTRDDGAPHVVPTWFAWDGEAITILSKPTARKARNLRDDPRAMVGLGDAEDDFDVGLLETTAEILDEPAPPDLPWAFRAKYGRRIEALGLTPAEFAATYSTMIRLTPARALDWRGRYRRAAPSSRPARAWARPVTAVAGAA